VAVQRSSKRTFGGLDIAFNNAGTLGGMGSTLAGAQDTNLTGAFRGAKRVVVRHRPRPVRRRRRVDLPTLKRTGDVAAS
jgi:NAD(P)-dependent dehydrogenase (short-subunit alcohol dehydrogenase family)